MVVNGNGGLGFVNDLGSYACVIVDELLPSIFCVSRVSSCSCCSCGSVCKPVVGGATAL